MKTAFLFPGQGAQFIGMGKDICEKYEEANKVYEQASKILGIDVKKMCFEGTEEELNKTQNTQIAIAVTSLAILEVLKSKGIKADVSVGLSLGEYVALIYSGYISFEEGIKLLEKRGYYMASFLPEGNFEMAAVIGLDSSIIEDVCKKIRANGKFVVPANYNYSDQTVISGESEGIEDAIIELNNLNAKRVIKLKTSGPFHTEKLNKARELFSKELEKASFSINENKVIKNIDGDFYKKEDNFRDILANHIVSSVRFDKAIKKMKDEGIDIDVEIGPGKALSGFVKKELKGEEIRVFSVSDVKSLEEFVNSDINVI
ncbi:MAG: ACP S-malonyltransferase [Clostridia bacterium]|nr:ACP S-malonyltransferase [Clostridia bacterium]